MHTKLIIVAACAVLVAATGLADEPRRVYKTEQRRAAAKARGEKTEPKAYTSLQIVFAPGLPASSDTTNVYGLKLGVPCSSGKSEVYGLEAAGISSSTDYVDGMQTSVIVNVCELLDGLQAGLVNVATVSMNGLQLGLVNYSAEDAFQIGLVNVLPQGDLPFFPLFNFNYSSPETYIQDHPDPQ